MKNCKIILSHPTGNEFVRAALNGLLDEEMLQYFYTTIACFTGNRFDLLSKIPALSEFNRRRFNDSLSQYTKMLPSKEIGRLISSKLNLEKLIEHEKGYYSVDSVYTSIDQFVAKELNNLKNVRLDAIYAYEDGALNSFKVAKQKNIKCLYDLPIGYWRSARKLLADEKKRWPEWWVTIPGFKDSEVKLAKKDEELMLADNIFVASTFTANTLKDYPGKLAPLNIITYAFPEVVMDRNYNSIKNRPLKLLFVGGLSQRKGIADLFKAMESFTGEIELTIVGHKSSNECKALDLALKKYKWYPSLPHSEVLKLMRNNDVLIFPSLFEGFGLVITEAMSQGTPVITTDRTAGPDLINHGKNGWLIEAGSTVAIENVLKEILQNTDALPAIAMAAMETAKTRSWSVYGNELAEAIKMGV